MHKRTGGANVFSPLTRNNPPTRNWLFGPEVKAATGVVRREAIMWMLTACTAAIITHVYYKRALQQPQLSISHSLFASLHLASPSLPWDSNYVARVIMYTQIFHHKLVFCLMMIFFGAKLSPPKLVQVYLVFVSLFCPLQLYQLLHT